MLFELQSTVFRKKDVCRTRRYIANGTIDYRSGGSYNLTVCFAFTLTYGFLGLTGGWYIKASKLFIVLALKVFVTYVGSWRAGDRFE
jgi:hypothetical protein